VFFGIFWVFFVGFFFLCFGSVGSMVTRDEGEAGEWRGHGLSFFQFASGFPALNKEEGKEVGRLGGTACTAYAHRAHPRATSR
jgi:hypothetical protein